MPCDFRNLTTGARCPNAAVEVSLTPCRADRPNVRAAFCDDHGGQDRARRHCATDWMILAPHDAGDAEAVMEAGAMMLGTEDRVIVIRFENGRFVASLGVGSHTVYVANPFVDSEKTRRSGGGGRRRGKGRSFASFDEAREAAMIAWRKRRDDDVEAIRRARGGTLDWGAPIRVPAAPIILGPIGPGVTAWAELQRVGPSFGMRVNPISGEIDFEFSNA